MCQTPTPTPTPTKNQKPKTRPINPKQARFVQEYVVDFNATQAAIRAGYSAKTASGIARRLLQKNHVMAAIQRTQEKLARRVEITQDDVVRDLMDVRDRCLAIANYRDALRALELLGRHLGMFASGVSAKIKIDEIDVSAGGDATRRLARRIVLAEIRGLGGLVVDDDNDGGTGGMV